MMNSGRVTRCVGKLTFVQKATEDNTVETTVSVEQLTRDEALDVAGVTRCRYCKHASASEAVISGNWQHGNCRNPRFRGSLHCANAKADGFCAWGEPKEAE